MKAGWQDHGHFKAEVSGDAKKLSTTAPAGPQVALFVHIEENAQYNLGGITFKNNRVLTDSAKLRDLPMRSPRYRRNSQLVKNRGYAQNTGTARFWLRYLFTTLTTVGEGRST